MALQRSCGLPVVAHFTSVDQERRVLHQPWPNAVRRLKLYSPLLFNCASENSNLPLNCLHSTFNDTITCARICGAHFDTLNLWSPFAARNFPICVTKALVAGSLSDLTVIATCSHPISRRKASVLYSANSAEDFACTTVDMSILVVLSSCHQNGKQLLPFFISHEGEVHVQFWANFFLCQLSVFGLPTLGRQTESFHALPLRHRLLSVLVR